MLSSFPPGRSQRVSMSDGESPSRTHHSLSYFPLACIPAVPHRSSGASFGSYRYDSPSASLSRSLDYEHATGDQAELFISRQHPSPLARSVNFENALTMQSEWSERQEEMPTLLQSHGNARARSVYGPHTGSSHPSAQSHAMVRQAVLEVCKVPEQARGGATRLIVLDSSNRCVPTPSDRSFA